MGGSVSRETWLLNTNCVHTVKRVMRRSPGLAARCGEAEFERRMVYAAPVHSLYGPEKNINDAFYVDDSDESYLNTLKAPALVPPLERRLPPRFWRQACTACWAAVCRLRARQWML